MGARSLAYSAELDRVLSGVPRSERRHLETQVRHFTLNEAEKRDQIVLDYFGTDGVEMIATAVAERVLSAGLGGAPAILDVGAGVGTFTIRIQRRIKKEIADARFYATDLTPAMLEVLSGRATGITAFVGVAEDLSGSVGIARSHAEVPQSFDSVVSTLALHHFLDTRRVLRSMRDVLKVGGQAIVVDLVKHGFTEFKREMGDVHLGFDLDELNAVAGEVFDGAKIEKLPSACRCSESGRSAGLFIAKMIRDIN